MSSDVMTAERALVRLRQLGAEQRTAVDTDNVDLLCRIADLVPNAVEALRMRGVPDTPEARQIIAEAKNVNAMAKAFLCARMADSSKRLRSVTCGQRVISGYCHPHRNRMYDKRG